MPQQLPMTEALRLVLTAEFAYNYADEHPDFAARFTDADYQSLSRRTAHESLGEQRLEQLAVFAVAEHWSPEDFLLAALEPHGPTALLERIDAALEAKP